MAEQGSEQGQQLAQDAKEAAQQAKGSVRDVVDASHPDGARGARDAVAENVSQLQGKVQDVAEQLRGVSLDDAQGALSSVLEWERKQPAYALVGALLVGFLLGRTWGRRTGRDD